MPKIKNKIIVLGVGMSFLLGGCFNMDDSKKITNQTPNDQVMPSNSEKKDTYVSVQEYTGEGYELDNGEETDKIAEAHREEIDKAVKKFFQEKYKTEVIVHNIVGAADGATVFVESVGEPHFYTFAIVPIDIDQEKVLTDKVWSQEGQVEDAIMSAIYAMIFDEELAKLDHYLEKVTHEYPLTGTRKEANANVGAKGYSTPYYYINTLDDAFESLYKLYLENPKMSKTNWKNSFEKNSFEPKGLILTIDLYMKKPNTQPDKEIFNKIVSDLENMEGLPRGSYSVLLNDNRVNKKTAIGTKENTLERSDPRDIIKN